MEGRYARCERDTPIRAQLATSTGGAFSSVCAPAREVVRHIEFRYAPKRGGLINIAVNARGALTRQSMRGRRVGDLEELRRATGAWTGSSRSLTSAAISSQSTSKVNRNEALGFSLTIRLAAADQFPLRGGLRRGHPCPAGQPVWIRARLAWMPLR